MNLSNIDIHNYSARILFQKSAIEYSVSNTVMHISCLEDEKRNAITLGDLKNPMETASKAFRKANKAIKHYLNSWFIDELPIHKKGLEELQNIVDKCIDLLNSDDDNDLDIAEDLLQKHGLWQSPNFLTIKRVLSEQGVSSAVASKLKEEWIVSSKQALLSLKKKTNPLASINAAEKKILHNIIFAGVVALGGAVVLGISGTGSGFLALGITFLKGVLTDFQKDKGIMENIKIGIKSIYEYLHTKKGLQETSEVFDNLTNSLKKPPTTKMRKKYLELALDQLNLYHDVMTQDGNYVLNREKLVPFLSKNLRIEAIKANEQQKQIGLMKQKEEANDQFFIKDRLAKKLDLEGNAKPYVFAHFNRLVSNEKSRMFRRRQPTVHKVQANSKI